MNWRARSCCVARRVVGRATQQERTNRKPPTLVRSLINMLVLRPGLARQLDAQLLAGRSVEDDVLRKLHALALVQPDLAPGAMLQSLQGEMPEQLRMELSAGLMQIPDALELEHEFAGA